MDILVKHWAFPRQFPSACPVLNIGDVDQKDDVVRQRFNTCNFSLILRGRGTYYRKKKLWSVLAPCVITQWPGEPLQYGPAKGETWDELYLIYDASMMGWFRQRGFVDESRPVWPIHNIDGVLEHVESLRALFHQPSESSVDRVDRICERIILESLLPGVKSEPPIADAVVRRIVTRLHRNLQEAHDFPQMAREYGVSYSTLRRRWIAAMRVTPGRYLLNMRIQKARQLLAETTLQVREIATRTGFQDILYFSRRFKLETKLNPSQYRLRYRSGIAG